MRRSHKGFGILVAMFAGCARPAITPIALTPRSWSPPLPSGTMLVSTRGGVLAPDEPHAPPVAIFTRAGVPLRVLEERPGSRSVLVEVPSSTGFQLRGLVESQELGAVVCASGILSNEIYAGQGTILSLSLLPFGPEVGLNGFVLVPRLGAPEQRPFTVAVAASRLCSGPKPAPERMLTSGVVGLFNENDFPRGAELISIPAGEALTARAVPNGSPVLTMPAKKSAYSLPRVERRDGWDRVAIGAGPYLLAWIPSHAVSARVGDPDAVFGTLVGRATTQGGSGCSSNLFTQELGRLPLRNVPAGVPVHLGDKEVARTSSHACARVMSAAGAAVEVTLAASEDLTVRGWIPASALGSAVLNEDR